ncbi:MBL fold metallo-hydrolase [Oceanobacillus salinisoli]|uniref:MBL fold metallo-hydrolase n=1 Tax=Oceanobacillus salinisoli TaxID=2678611 RepID=UPI0012E2B79C|nr:MBL fold metallo-hydrolase [Oceanobacillus salinisoli]
MKCTVIGMWGGFPKKNGPCSGYLIEKNGFSLLVDCGSGVVSQMQNYVDLNDVNHVVLSHYHYDHFSDVGVLLFSRLVNTQLRQTNEILHIYGPDDSEMARRVREVPYSDFHPYGEECSLTIGPFTIEFLCNLHPVEAYSMKITCDEGKTIVYTSDTGFTEDLVTFSEGTDLLITECSLYDGMNGAASGHMTAGEAGVLANRSHAKQVILSHLPHYGDLEELLDSAKGEGNDCVMLAEVGMEVEV